MIDKSGYLFMFNISVNPITVKIFKMLLWT